MSNEIRDGMRIDWDLSIEMDDGIAVRCDVYRPIDEGRHPVILTYGPYGKWLHFEDLYAEQWQRMADEHHIGFFFIQSPVALVGEGKGRERAAAIERQRFTFGEMHNLAARSR